MAMTIEPCGDCGMPCEPGEYHPFAACLMFKACHQSDVVRANLQFVVDHGKGAHLTQPAQAVDVGTIRDVIETVKRIDPHWSQLPKLERALSAEKVGWRDGLVREARRCVGAFEQFAGRDFGRCDPEDMHLVIVEAHHGLSCALPASPTPDKEG
jgi:hypothetical protein